MLTDKEADNDDIIEKARNAVKRIFGSGEFEVAYTTPIWYEEIRPLDAFCCANRMRGLNFIEKNVDT